MDVLFDPWNRHIIGFVDGKKLKFNFLMHRKEEV